MDTGKDQRDQGELFYTVEDLARIFQVKPQTIRGWRKRGILPQPLKLGRLIRWPRSVIMDIAQWAGRRPAENTQP